MSSDATESLPTWRLWGEEKVDGAIYTVYLKKVRYHRPNSSHLNSLIADARNTDRKNDEITHLEWETVRVRFVKAATLKKLVEALATDDGELESTYINVFLATYRTFSNTNEVLNLLLERYDDLLRKNVLGIMYEEQTNIDQHKKTLVSALHVWLDSYPEDFRTPPEYLELKKIIDFAKQRLALHCDLATKALHKLELFKSEQLQRLYNDTSTYLYCSTPQNLCLRNGFNHLYCSSASNITGSQNLPAKWPSSPNIVNYQFPDVPVRHFAEQLTRMDMELFKKLIPHQCLGAIWSKRRKRDSKHRKNEAATVIATVNQFNAVSFRVISSILVAPSSLKFSERAAIIACWIDIAQELRILKNFSSLKAIISGLQSNSIYRLRKTWACLPKEKIELFEELARIFSEENNQLAQRELLMREGTAKFADTFGEKDKQLQKILQKQTNFVSYGTIPYLGTFLTDLTMIDTAIPDYIIITQDQNMKNINSSHRTRSTERSMNRISDRLSTPRTNSEDRHRNNEEKTIELINFDKRRKEFEVLAQIKLLQGAANAYNLNRDPAFDKWFDSVLVLDDSEAYELSLNIEKGSQNINSRMNNKNSSPLKNKNRHRKNDSITSTSSSNSSQFYCDFDNMLLISDVSEKRLSISASSSTSSLPSLDVSLASNGSHKLLCSFNATAQSTSPVKGKHSNGPSTSQNSPSSSQSDFYIIKVTYEDQTEPKNESKSTTPEMDGVVLYKSIMLCNNERTPQVIRNAMMKLGLDGNPEEYTLAQVLPNKELQLPHNANVYYAINTAYNLNFILRKKSTSINSKKK